MASKSRAVQAQLEELEKLSAPFEDQLAEAAKFIGVHFEEDGSLSNDFSEAEKLAKIVPYRREEWLLIWLLKKLKGEEIARKNPSSWWLLSYIIKALPVRTAARLLAGRDVVVEEKPSKEGKNSILLQTLEEMQKSVTHIEEPIGSKNKDKSTKASKKRKHTGELVDSTEHSQSLPQLLEAVSEFMSVVVVAGSVISGTSNNDVGAALSAAYMKTVITTTAEKAAVIFGLWLSQCSLALNMLQKVNMIDGHNWLTPFIEMWDSRVADEDSLARFSVYCTRPLLSLLRILKDEHITNTSWLPQVEQLMAKNIIIPAKAATRGDEDSDVLSMLVRAVVYEDPINASPLFEIAIRSIQPQGSKRRPPQDNAWLQNVFDTLRISMAPQKSTLHGSSIKAMLKSAIHYKVSLELEGLRAVTVNFAFQDDQEDWELLATLITLDANLFLIPDEETNLLQTLLDRITKASLSPLWPNLSEQVVSQVLVPLMGEFSKARDLSGFIRHWFAQIVQFEKFREEERLTSLEYFSAWEDDALHSELKRLFEPSLTIQQINQILDWLSTEVSENPEAVCLILEAIAGSISTTEAVDQVSLRLYHIMFDDDACGKLDSRYSWRAWRIISRTMDWALPSDVDEIKRLWDQGATTFNLWSEGSSPSSLLDICGENRVALDNLEILRCAGATLSAAGKGSQMEALIEPVILDYLRSLKQDLDQFLRDLTTDSNIGDEVCGLECNTLYRGIGWMMWAFVQCVFVEYPKMLCLGLAMENDSFREMISTILWIASAGHDNSHKNLPAWLKINNNAFSILWTTSLQSVEVQNNKKLVEMMVDAMLCNGSDISNPLLKSQSTNVFVFHVLNHVPLDIINKSDRERIMKGFFVTDNQDEPIIRESSHTMVSDPNILALKRRVMANHPNLYEGLEFKTLLETVDPLLDKDASIVQTSIAILKDLVRLSLAHAHINLDQTRRRTYVTETFKMIQEKTRKASEKKKYELNYGQVAMFEAAIHEFQKKTNALDELGIITKEDLEASVVTLKTVILVQFKDLLHAMRKAKNSMPLQCIYLQIAMDCLASLGVDSTDLANLTKDAQKFLKLQSEQDVKRRLRTFLAVHTDLKYFEDNFGVDVTTVSGREAIQEVTIAETNGKSGEEKLELLRSILTAAETSLTTDKVLTAKHIIALIDDTQKLSKTEHEESKDDDDDNDSDDEIEQSSNFDLTNTYIILCQRIQRTTDIFQFCIISETLELMLKSKPRAISQYAIDLSLGAISILCSPAAPPLPAARSGTVYLHLCALLRTIITHHRLKLKGHFPLLQLSMQGLLRCLFLPLSHSSTRTKSTPAEFGHAPSWLSSPPHQLSSKHAEAYTRLLTLICDPSASSVRGPRQNNLVSATEKWKRMALLYMRFVLMDYIKWQLEMRMLPGVREALVPGLYAIFDTTTLETRRLISSELTTSERAVFGTLFRDYQKFGKWKGA